MIVPQQSGYQLLKRYSDKIDVQTDNLSIEIIQGYTASIRDLEHKAVNVKTIRLESVKFYEQFPWYLDFIRKYNIKSIDFFAQDLTCLNKVAIYSVMAISIYLPAL